MLDRRNLSSPPPYERNVRSLAFIEAMATSSPRVSLVIPALNEARNLPHVFAQLPCNLYEVVLVDGNSRDGTAEVAKALWPDIRIIRQNRRGKGNALACGFAACRGDIIVMLDADGSTSPAEIPRFVETLIAGADFAKGSRFIQDGGSTDLTRLRRTGNRFLSAVVNALYGTSYSDLCYGYNAFWSGYLPLLGLDPGRSLDGDEERRLWGDGFEVETLINVRIAKAGLQVTEVASFERTRLHGMSNLNAFSDGLRVLRTIAIERWGNLLGTTMWTERQRLAIQRCPEHDWPHLCPATVAS
jgi:glycosyltransferase involved in cell wall biosynthesis